MNRGLIEAAATEGQLAGVMAHEIAHVALRHGTHQASKANLAQTGLSLLGGLIGKKNPGTSQLVSAVGGFGLNTLFLKYSRDIESEADALGAEIMASAGYDPNEMADFFDELRREQARDPSKLEQFFSDHPSPVNRSSHIRGEAAALKPAAPRRNSAAFVQAKSELKSMPAARSMGQIAQSGPAQTSSSRNATAVPASIERPSTRSRTFVQRGRFYSIAYPENWQVYPSTGYGVTIAPAGGIVEGTRQPVIVTGVIVNHYAPFSRSARQGKTSLERATNDIVNQLRASNPELQPVRNSGRRQVVSGYKTLSVVLSGPSPLTGQDERITVFTRALADEHVIYALFIAPERDYGALSQTYSTMMQSVRVNEAASHP